MDPLEASSIVFSRIRKFEPTNVANKIIGYLLVQDRCEEMIRLAFGPDNLILSLIQRVKTHLESVQKPVTSPPVLPSVNVAQFSDRPLAPYSRVSAPTTMRIPNPYWKPQHNPEHQLMVNTKFSPEDFSLQDQLQFGGVEDQLEQANSGISPFSIDYYYPETVIPRGPRSPSEFPFKTCHYFNKGFCKHGSNCKFFHGQSFPESFSQISGPGLDDTGFEDQILSAGSLEKLESEITELLRMRRGTPVSIASLPMLYYEKYGRTLQAEGYLTESQRHGKAGYSLTKLLARLKNSVRLIDRPHGQHSVILAEDAQNYFESRFDRNDPGPIVSGSRQIYLTFPADSSFSEEDVSDYFSTYGPVQDVRIPCQHKRMFGFVTFASADTVTTILSKGNPHYVCGARVLVKPYREKPKLIERSYLEKLDPSMFYNSHYADFNSEIPSRWESSRMLRKPFVMEQEQELEAQTKRFSELQLARKSLAKQSYLGYSMGELRANEDHSKFPSAERFNYLMDVLNTGSMPENYLKPAEETNHAEQEESAEVRVDLPDSPFAPPALQ